MSQNCNIAPLPNKFTISLAEEVMLALVSNAHLKEG